MRHYHRAPMAARFDQIRDIADQFRAAGASVEIAHAAELAAAVDALLPEICAAAAAHCGGLRQGGPGDRRDDEREAQPGHG